MDTAALGLARGGGQALPASVRGRMEAALGADFSAVRVHVGPQAQRIGAVAFTTGTDIYFAPGRYQPDTLPGQQLLGHELAHVVQQRQGRVRHPTGVGLAVVQDRALEAEADRLGQRAAWPGPARGPATLPAARPPWRGAAVLTQCRRPVIQREVEHNGTAYAGNGERARWRVALKRAVIDDYNLRTGKSLPYNTDVSDEDLDRCHKISFDDIETMVVNYLNNVIDQQTFINLTASLTAPSQYKEVGKWRTFLIEAKTNSGPVLNIVSYANRLLSILNSSLFNVLLGAASTNRSIQQKLDLHFTDTGAGFSLTPISRNLVTTWSGNASGLPLTPGGTNIKSSFATGGVVPLGNLTPNTDTLFNAL